MLRILPVQTAARPPVAFAGKKARPLPEPDVPTTPPFPSMGWKCLQPDLFSPLPQTEALKRFAVIGDAGNGSQAQYDIGAQMARTWQERPFASVLVLGDNIYEYGDPRLFDTRIEAPYKTLLDNKVRFYAVMGNHDVVKGYGPQQMAYWGVPSFFNRRLGNVEIFGIDTTVFLPGYAGCYADNPFLAYQQAAVQLAWLDKALGASTAKYKVVFGHYPLYSSGLHGTKEDATIRLRHILEPMLVKHGVDIYLAGHEHHYEKSQVLNGVQHFVSGAAGKLRPNIHYKDNPPYPREKIFARYHFMLFEETPQGLKYEVIGKKGKVLDSGLVVKQARPVQLRFAG